MKLIFSPSSPFVRKVRIAAIELGLIDRIEFLPTTVAPGQPNDDYARITPLKKLPALILDNGDVILHDVDEESGVVTVELIGACVTCPASTVTLKAGLERILKDRVEGVTEVRNIGETFIESSVSL